MAAALKDRYNQDFIGKLSQRIKNHYAKFDEGQFQQAVFDSNWQQRELKQRLRHITETLHRFLPSDYLKSLEILKSAAPYFSGFEPMFFPDYVELYGLNDWDESILALEHFTQYSSSEFAVRPFILQDKKKMMRQMLAWTSHESHHVRRLASEGCRPRLPWAMSLPVFKKDPGAILKVIEPLKKDTSDYVRRSVANNLNDISKDHPNTVLNIAEKWLGQSPETDWVIKHACRSLLKQGNHQALKLFGFTPPHHIQLSELCLTRSSIRIGESLEFGFTLDAKKSLGKLRVEFAIDYKKSHGGHSRKIFMLSETTLPSKTKEFLKKHSLQQRSTRKHYPGKHHLTIVINGVAMSTIDFSVTSER